MKNKIKVQRVIHNITQVALAQKMGVSAWTISQMEMNNYVPSLQTATRIAKFFRVRVEELFSFDEEYTCAEEPPEWMKII